ncbi:CBO0543 family protein [Paenibacillus sp. S-38]|uniref:CBO0543 family protein n=1 Tax=Paenibacillus sp. S-38 TaxID=3416710 RepID=UPI003CF8EA58
MILLTNVILLFLTLITKVIRKWKVYYSTLLFVPMVNGLYNTLCADKLPWSYEDSLLSHKAIEMLDTLILLPGTTILYLHFYPQNNYKQLYYLGWIAVYTAVEYTWHLGGHIQYEHGWNLYWSLLFYFAMFLAVRLHQTRAIAAWCFSIAYTSFLMAVFDISLFD